MTSRSEVYFAKTKYPFCVDVLRQFRDSEIEVRDSGHLSRWLNIRLYLLYRGRTTNAIAYKNLSGSAMLGSIAECKYKHDNSDRQRGRVSGVDRVDSRVKAQVVKACNAPFGIAPVDARFFGVYLVPEAVAIFEFNRLQKLVSVKEGQREALYVYLLQLSLISRS